MHRRSPQGGGAFVVVLASFFLLCLLFCTTLIRAEQVLMEEEGFVAADAGAATGGASGGVEESGFATTPTTTATATGNGNNNGNTLSDKEKRLWGSKTGTSEAPPLGALVMDPEPQPHRDIPFVFKSASSNNNNNHKIHHEPPQGFQITSRVFTDPKDKLAHFDNDSAMVFPYWECGVSGSTTVPIPLQHATVRYLLGGSQPTVYSGAEFGPYPQLVVALSPLEISLDSGQVQLFHAGDVILLEDTISVGHKLKGIDNKDMTVLILTLTEPYHQVGKAKTSLTSILLNKDDPHRWKISPCPNGLEFSRVEEGGLGRRQWWGPSSMMGRVLRPWHHPRLVRKYVLSVVGLSFSTWLADGVGRVAPLWLAVLFGGGCFVAGGTLTFVKVGDKALNEFEMWKEQRQLRLQGPVVVDDDDTVRPDDSHNDNNNNNNNNDDIDKKQYKDDQETISERPEGVPQIPLPT